MTKTVVFLFDTTGLAAWPFTRRGCTTFIIDTQNIGERATNPLASHTLDWNILTHIRDIINLKPDLLIGFPPCTDLAVSGAKHFAAKAAANPNFQKEAVQLARTVEQVGNEVGCPWALENPNSVLSTIWRKPDFTLDPNEYGRYLPEDDVHPLWPDYIPARDAYYKTTNWWTGNGFQMPQKKFVPILHPGKWNPQTTKLGGKSARTKMIRSASPRGVFEALAQQYCKETS
jgi:hypothetical protein